MGASKSANRNVQPGAAAQSIPQYSRVTRSRSSASTPLLQLEADGKTASGLVNTGRKSSDRVRQARQGKKPASLQASKTSSQFGRPDHGAPGIPNQRSTRSRKRARDDDDEPNEPVSKKQREQLTSSRRTKPSQRAQGMTTQPESTPARRRKRTEAENDGPVSKRLRRNAYAPTQASSQHAPLRANPSEPHARSKRKRGGPETDRSDVKRPRGEPSIEQAIHDENPPLRRRSSRVAQNRLNPVSQRVRPPRKSSKTIGTGPVVLIPIGLTAGTLEEALRSPEQPSDEARYLHKLSTAPDPQGNLRPGTLDNTRHGAPTDIIPPRLMDWVAEPFPIVYRLTDREWKGTSFHREDRSVSVDSDAQSFAGDSTRVQVDTSDINDRSESAIQIWRNFSKLLFGRHLDERILRGVNAVQQHEPDILEEESVRVVIALCLLLLRPRFQTTPEERLAHERKAIQKLPVSAKAMRAALPGVARALASAGIQRSPETAQHLDRALRLEDRPLFPQWLARIDAAYDGKVRCGSEEDSLFGDSQDSTVTLR
ncbi:MAG: hypothetical protein Q9174_003000 [Haloplaca sp. 1 TL-2023]